MQLRLNPVRFLVGMLVASVGLVGRRRCQDVGDTDVVRPTPCGFGPRKHQASWPRERCLPCADHAAFRSRSAMPGQQRFAATTHFR